LQICFENLSWGFQNAVGCGGFFAELLNHSMFEIFIVLGENDGLVDFPGQKLESGIKLELLSGVAIFGKLDFEEVEPIFWFHLLEGANLNLRALHCGKMGLAQLQAQQ